MGLEAPLALLGLLAAVLPLLAHRIRRRDLVPVVLPTFALLQMAEAKKRKSRGLTDLLLLLLRIAIIAAACIGIGAPYVTAALSFGDGTIASAAIVIDDSMSMMQTEGGETLLAQAIEKAEQAIASLPQGSEVTLIAGGAPARLLLPRTTDLSQARRTLQRLETSSVRGADLKGAMQLAAKQLQSAKEPSHRLLLLSDFASHTGLEPDDLRIEDTQLSIDRLGTTPPPPNLFFASLRAVPEPGAKDQVSLAIELGASGKSQERVHVTIHSAGRQVAGTTISLSNGRGRSVVLVPAPAPEADPTALLRIDAADAIAIDNTAGVMLRAAHTLRVMLVNGDPRPASDADELHYLQLALRALPNTKGAIAARTVDTKSLSQYDLTHVDVVVLANVSAPEASVVARLSRFVAQGGGLLIAAGSHVEPRPYNAALSEILPCKLRARMESPSALEAPSDDRLLPAGPSGLTKALVQKRLMLDCERHVYLRFADGSPALAIADIGRGKSAFFATTLDADWNDLPLRPGYVPLLSRLVRSLARADSIPAETVKALSSVTIGVPPSAGRLEVVAPDGARTPYDIAKDQATILFEHTDQPGPYRVLSKGEGGLLAEMPRGAFVVQAPSAESDLTPLPELRAFERQIVSRKTTGMTQRSLTPLVLLAFGLLVLAEGTLRSR